MKTFDMIKELCNKKI